MYGFRHEDGEEAMEFFDNPNFVHFVGPLIRPGVRLCFIKLEYGHFPPGTRFHEEFFLRLTDWDGVRWGIASIPRKKWELVDPILSKVGLIITGDIPRIIIGGVLKVLPFEGEGIFSLENTLDHPVHESSPDEYAAMLEAETREIERIISQRPN